MDIEQDKGRGQDLGIWRCGDGLRKGPGGGDGDRVMGIEQDQGRG